MTLTRVHRFAALMLAWSIASLVRAQTIDCGAVQQQTERAQAALARLDKLPDSDKVRSTREFVKQKLTALQADGDKCADQIRAEFEAGSPAAGAPPGGTGGPVSTATSSAASAAPTTAGGTGPRARVVRLQSRRQATQQVLLLPKQRKPHRPRLRWKKDAPALASVVLAEISSAASLASSKREPAPPRASKSSLRTS